MFRGAGVGELVRGDVDEDLGNSAERDVGDLPPDVDRRHFVAGASIVTAVGGSFVSIDEGVSEYTHGRQSTYQGLVSYTRYWTMAPITPEIVARTNPRVIRSIRPNFMFLRSRNGYTTWAIKGETTMITKGLKCDSKSLGAPSEVIAAPWLLDTPLIPPSFRYQMGMYRKIWTACQVRWASLTSFSDHAAGVSLSASVVGFTLYQKFLAKRFPLLAFSAVVVILMKRVRSEPCGAFRTVRLYITANRIGRRKYTIPGTRYASQKLWYFSM